MKSLPAIPTVTATRTSQARTKSIGAAPASDERTSRQHRRPRQFEEMHVQRGSLLADEPCSSYVIFSMRRER
jgi:hypothetical protein